MRARLVVAASQQSVELREILLRDKPQAFLNVSPSATVPCLVLDGQVIDESLDVMKWALAINDPLGWLEMPSRGWDWIERADGPFKNALDRTKYATRYPEEDAGKHREFASAFLTDLNSEMGDWIFDNPTLADYAILPFVRQFAFIDKAWFDGQPWPKLHQWLERFLVSEAFERIMVKYDPWKPNDKPIFFP